MPTTAKTSTACWQAARRERAALVYLSNPDNPMGTWWEADEVARFIEALPETTMLVLDEAYGETGPAAALPPLDVSRPNVLRMRTFSKAYGLAGMRCGYAVGEAAVIRDFEKIRNHYGVNRMAQVAGEAALADQAYLGEVVRKVAAGRERIAEIARGERACRDPVGHQFRDHRLRRATAPSRCKVLEGLLARDVFVRKPMAPVLDRCIRVSVGRDDELDIFAEELPARIARRVGRLSRPALSHGRRRGVSATRSRSTACAARIFSCARGRPNQPARSTSAKRSQPAAAWRPLHLEHVARQGRQVEIGLAPQRR